MIGFCMSYNFLKTIFVGKVKSVVNCVFKVDFIVLSIILNKTAIFDICTKVCFSFN